MPPASAPQDVDLLIARWIKDSVPDLRVQLVRRAIADVGICEMPPGSNRSGVIDDYCKRSGCPVGSYWCAAAMYCWWQDCGAETPKRGLAPSCDEWVKWAKKEGLWRTEPEDGFAIIYFNKKDPTDAYHIGQVIRASPYLATVEGNTSTGGAFARNGVAVWPKAPDLKQYIVGYIEPRTAK